MSEQQAVQEIGEDNLAPAPEPAVEMHDLEQELEEQLAAATMDSLFTEDNQDFREGEVVVGRVVEVMDDRVLVDIGYKSEGTVNISEFSQPDLLEPGYQFDVFIDEPENEHGMPVLSKIKADRIKNWEIVQKIYEEDGIIEGVIARRVKGGLKVDIGIDAFMPASQLTFRPTGDLERYIGEKMKVKIIKLTKRRRNVVVSRRKLLEEERAGEKQRLLDTIAIGKIIPGEVKNITDFGAFVDVGGIDGLLHVTDMSWGRVKHPSQVVSVGDKIEVMVLNFDPQTERISLGLKQKSENPWKTAVDTYPVGSVQRGKVVSMTDYGAFVQLEEGVEGMVHVSEMSWTRRVRHPNEILELDQEVDVMILSVDPDAEKIALGIKQTMPNPWKTIGDTYPIGKIVEGTVRNLTDYGAFIQLEEGIDGLLHVSDISWTDKVTHPNEILEKGQELRVKVLAIDPEAEKISVGIKQLEEDPWMAVIEKLPIGTHVEVEIAKLVSFGAFAKLDNGVEGLIHVSELADDRVQKPEEVLNVGDKVMAKVISVGPVDRKIGLSVREYERDLEKQMISDHGQSGGSVDVSAQVSRSVPGYEAGKSLEDVAHEMMAAVRGAEAASKAAEAGEPAPQAKEPVAEAKEAEAPVAEEPQTEAPAPEAKAEEEAPAADEPPAEKDPAVEAEEQVAEAEAAEEEKTE